MKNGNRNCGSRQFYFSYALLFLQLFLLLFLFAQIFHIYLILIDQKANLCIGSWIAIAQFFIPIIEGIYHVTPIVGIHKTNQRTAMVVYHMNLFLSRV